MKYFSLFFLSNCLLFAEDVMQTSTHYCCDFAPSARFYNSDCWGFYVNIDPVIWQARINGIGLAIETKENHDFFQPSGQSRVKNLQFHWDWGFRLGIGLNTAHDGWDLLLQWTYWQTDAKRDFSSGENQTNFPHFGHPNQISALSANKVRSKWELHYQFLDLEMARAFWISRCVSFRPFGGLRSAWINQAQLALDLANLSHSLFSNYSILQSDRFWGLGIRSGLDVQWSVGLGLSLFNHFAGNLLYSYHSVKHREKANKEDVLDVGNFFHLCSAIFDMQIGIRYDWVSCDCCSHIGIEFGWENQWLPGQNQFILFVNDIMPGKFVANQGDLGIQGYFLKLRFDF